MNYACPKRNVRGARASARWHGLHAMQDLDEDAPLCAASSRRIRSRSGCVRVFSLIAFSRGPKVGVTELPRPRGRHVKHCDSEESRHRVRVTEFTRSQGTL